MYTSTEFISALSRHGFDFFTGVPCSFLTPLLNRIISDPGLKYVAATNEGEAVAIAAGAWLADKKTVVSFQNSGLGNAVNPLTSLNYPFNIPQHELMGRRTKNILSAIEIPFEHVPSDVANLERVVKLAAETIDHTDRPFALILSKDTFFEEPLEQIGEETGSDRPTILDTGDDGTTFPADLPSRFSVLTALQDQLPENALIIATTGKCGRELFTLRDRPRNLYQVGSMGCASAMALGLALNTSQPVIVLDGDGAALMHMGNLATIGAEAPRNLIHVLLDNGVHDSTGGQRTVSHGMSFTGIASACGYRMVTRCTDVDMFSERFSEMLKINGPSLCHVLIAPGSVKKLGRPTILPKDVARRFRKCVSEPC